MNDIIKRCPFCDGVACCCKSGVNGGYRVHCHDCGCELTHAKYFNVITQPCFKTAEEAIVCWNRRRKDESIFDHQWDCRCGNRNKRHGDYGCHSCGMRKRYRVTKAKES